MPGWSFPSTNRGAAAVPAARTAPVSRARPSVRAVRGVGLALALFLGAWGPPALADTCPGDLKRPFLQFPPVQHVLDLATATTGELRECRRILAVCRQDLSSCRVGETSPSSVEREIDSACRQICGLWERQNADLKAVNRWAGAYQRRRAEGASDKDETARNYRSEANQYADRVVAGSREARAIFLRIQAYWYTTHRGQREFNRKQCESNPTLPLCREPPVSIQPVPDRTPKSLLAARRIPDIPAGVTAVRVPITLQGAHRDLTGVRVLCRPYYQTTDHASGPGVLGTTRAETATFARGTAPRQMTATLRFPKGVRDPATKFKVAYLTRLKCWAEGTTGFRYTPFGRCARSFGAPSAFCVTSQQDVEFWVTVR